tara:strand:- start:932 stop:1693 length:762 start_codon:yes stop_codon:yes gene_type:complete
MKKKKFFNYSYSFIISLILLIKFDPYVKQPAHAFFEDQAKYKILNHWYPMLSNSSPEKRFQAARAFLTYPEWSLPFLRNAIMSHHSENASRQIAMLIGFMGDSTDVQPLLKIWQNMDDNSPIWLGAMRRLYWKSRDTDPRSPVLKKIAFNFSDNLAESEIEEKTLKLLFQIENPAKTPRFIRVSANFWLTMTDENTPSKYFWISAGDRIESSIETNISPAFHSNKIRLDFRIWEVGLSEPILHRTGNISFPVN